MCRHFLPRFDLPIAQLAHSVGRLVATHPVSILAALLVPAAVVVVMIIHHRSARAIRGRLDPFRADPRWEPPGSAVREFQIVPQA